MDWRCRATKRFTIAFRQAGIGYGWCVDPQQYGDKTIFNASGLMMLLPYLDQMSLYSQYNQNQCAFNLMEGGSCCPPNTAVGKLAGDAVASGNASVIANRLAAFSCPSDTGDPYLGANSCGPAAAKTSYDFPSAST